MTSNLNFNGIIDMPVFKIAKKEELEQDSNNDNIDTTNTDSREDKDKIVVVEGSLGKVFTEALNKAYANESIETMMEYNPEEDEESDNKEKAYIYVDDGDDLDTNKTNTIMKHMRLALDENYDKIILSMENVHTVTDNLSLLDSYCTESNIELVYSSKTALSKL